MFPGQEIYLSGIVSSTKFCKPIVSNFSSIEKNSYAINFGENKLEYAGLDLGLFPNLSFPLQSLSIKILLSRQFNFQIELKFGNVNFWRKGKTKEENQEQQFHSQATTGLDGKTQIHRSLAGGDCFLPLRHPKIAPFSGFPRLVSCFRILTRVRQRFFNLTLVKLTKK